MSLAWLILPAIAAGLAFLVPAQRTVRMLMQEDFDRARLRQRLAQGKRFAISRAWRILLLLAVQCALLAALTHVSPRSWLAFYACTAVVFVANLAFALGDAPEQADPADRLRPRAARLNALLSVALPLCALALFGAFQLIATDISYYINFLSKVRYRPLNRNVYPYCIAGAAAVTLLALPGIVSVCAWLLRPLERALEKKN